MILTNTIFMGDIPLNFSAVNQHQWNSNKWPYTRCFSCWGSTCCLYSLNELHVNLGLEEWTNRMKVVGVHVDLRWYLVPDWNVINCLTRTFGSVLIFMWCFDFWTFPLGYFLFVPFSWPLALFTVFAATLVCVSVWSSSSYSHQSIFLTVFRFCPGSADSKGKVDSATVFSDDNNMINNDM